MRYLTAEEVLILHALVIDEFGGSHGVRDVGLLESIVHKERSSFGGRDLYQTLWGKAAAFCEALVRYHVFVDGNKRTALMATARFLAVNGYELSATNKEAERIILDIVTKKADASALAVWLKKHTHPTKRS
jgi:death-on-curing protein